MKVLKKFDYIYKFIIFILIFTFLLTIFNLIFNINANILKFIILIGMILYSFIIGIKKGLNTENKAYTVGLKTGAINILILYILGCFMLSFSLPLRKIIYYLIILITTILGCIIGINKKNAK